jgi:hypothetical protein
MVNHRLTMRMMPRIVGIMSHWMAIVRVNMTILALHSGTKLLTMGRIASSVGIVFRWTRTPCAPAVSQRAVDPLPYGWGLGGSGRAPPNVPRVTRRRADPASQPGGRASREKRGGGSEAWGDSGDYTK